MRDMIAEKYQHYFAEATRLQGLVNEQAAYIAELEEALASFLEEMAQTAGRARQMRKVIKTRTAEAERRADDAREVDFYGQDNSREANRAAHADRLLAQAQNRNAREKASKKTYDVGGKVVKSK